jgi:AraC family transcriptional regulator, transcriptional activator FtrA
MVADVAVLIAAPVPAFELGVVSELFGLRRMDPALPSYRYAVCAEHRTALPSSTGFAVTPSHGLRRLASADLVVVTGAAPPIPDPSPAVLGALRRAADRGATVAAVCTGAFVLAEAGLLDGRRATTHWGYADRLAERFPKVTVDPDRIYVVDGPIATSAGASAAIDLCLHLIRAAHGADVANRVAREMVVPAHRSGGQAQYTPTPVADPRRPGSEALAALLDWAAGHLDENLTVESLALRAAMSPRTFARHFADATGTTPAAWVRDQRLRRAEELLERDGATVAAIARRCGLGSPDTLRRHLHRARGVTPEQYRLTFGGP